MSIEREAEKILKAIGYDMVKSVKANFLAEGRPEKWKPSRRAKLQNGKTLRDTGLLMRSITYRIISGQVFVGTKWGYGKTMHFGAKKGRFGKTKDGTPIPYGNIPARPWLLIPKTDMNKLNRKLKLYITKAVANGFKQD